MNKVFSLTAFGWGVILIALFFYTDLLLPAVNQNSDYLMTFYTAGELVREGKVSQLYPPADAGTFVDTAFDKAAHVVLPLLPARATAEYMYMPAIAVFFVPLSLLSPSISLLVWQLISLASLAVCTTLFTSRFSNQDPDSAQQIEKTDGSPENFIAGLNEKSTDHELAKSSPAPVPPESAKSSPASAPAQVPSELTESSAVLQAETAKSSTSKGAHNLTASAFWLALTLVPLAISIWIGQISVVFGLLPFMAGMFFVLRKKDLLGGLIWALTVIKPQFLVPVLMITTALAISRRIKPLAGVIGGIAMFSILNVAVFSMTLIGQWLTTLKLAETVYSDLKFGVAQHIATSLPRAIILLLPVSQHPIAKPIIYTVSAILGGIGLYFCIRVMKSKLPDCNKLAIATVICIFATPMIVPHVFFYDYTMFIAAGFMVYALKWSSDLGFRLKSLLWLGWALTNAYAIILFTNKNFAVPILFVLLMLELYRRALVCAKLALNDIGSE